MALMCLDCGQVEKDMAKKKPSKRVDVGEREFVTVLLRSKGGGQIYVGAYGERSPREVALEALRRPPLLASVEGRALRERIGSLSESPSTYRETRSWAGA